MLAAIVQRLRETLPNLPVADMAAFAQRVVPPADAHAYVLLLAEEQEASERAGAARGRMKRTFAIILQARCAVEDPMGPEPPHPESEEPQPEKMPADVISPDVLCWALRIRHALEGWQPDPSTPPLFYRTGHLVQAEKGSLIWMMTFRHDEMLAAA